MYCNRGCLRPYHSRRCASCFDVTFRYALYKICSLQYIHILVQPTCFCPPLRFEPCSPMTASAPSSNPSKSSVKAQVSHLTQFFQFAFCKSKSLALGPGEEIVLFRSSHPATPVSRSRTLEGIIELTRSPSMALIFLHCSLIAKCKQNRTELVTRPVRAQASTTRPNLSASKVSPKTTFSLTVPEKIHACCGT